MGKTGFITKVKATVKLSHRVLLAYHMKIQMETEQWLTVVRILALATYAVSSSSLADL